MKKKMEAMPAEAGISGLRAEYRNGQVFLYWKENALPPGARLTVWGSREPIHPGNLARARKLAALLNPHSACDWWRDVSNFLVTRAGSQRSEEIFSGTAASETDRRKRERGFVVRDGGRPLDPASGLHVHTVSPEELPRQFYAVSWSGPGEEEPRGVITLKRALTLRCEEARAVLLRPGVVKACRACAPGKPLLIELHGRGGGVAVDRRGRDVCTHLFFTSSDLGWREGLPVKFRVMICKNVVKVRLCDRVWTGRKLTPEESPDSRDYVAAVSSFWLAYNRNIAVSNKGPVFQVDHYSERLIIAIIDYLQRELKTDPARTYVSGGSMGGTGAVQMALHYPERFAAVRAWVPVYSYTWRKCGDLAPSAIRLVCSCGFFSEKNPARLPDGRDLLDYASGEKQIASCRKDVPPIFSCNGRRDASMPWVNNPPFFRAADGARQAIRVYWNDGDHGMAGQVPADMRLTDRQLFSYRLDKPYAAFSNCSANGDFGNGDPAEGDRCGWINRGTECEVVEDSAERFAVKLRIAYPGAEYPIFSDVTFRRRQFFTTVPGEKLHVSLNGAESRAVVVPPEGLLTLKGLRFADRKTLLVEITRSGVDS